MSDNSKVIWQGRVIKGVVFDLDGTLTNSVDIYFEVLSRVLSSAGIDVRKQELFETLAQGRDPWKELIPGTSEAREKQINEFRLEMLEGYREAYKQIRPLPGTETVLRAMRALGLKLGIVTDSEALALRTLIAWEIFSCFDAIITRDDGFPRKPDPSGVLRCLGLMCVDPANALMIGDSVLDVRAGKKAGALTVGVLTGLGNKRLMEAATPTALIEKLSDLPELIGSNS